MKKATPDAEFHSSVVLSHRSHWPGIYFSLYCNKENQHMARDTLLHYCLAALPSGFNSTRFPFLLSGGFFLVGWFVQLFLGGAWSFCFMCTLMFFVTLH